MDTLTPKQQDAARRLRAALVELDDETRLPGEEPLLTTVAREARAAREALELSSRAGGES